MSRVGTLVVGLLDMTRKGLTALGLGSLWQFSSIELMSISQSLATKIFHDYKKAASNGDADAAFKMAVCYGTGFGVEQTTTR